MNVCTWFIFIHLTNPSNKLDISLNKSKLRSLVIFVKMKLWPAGESKSQKMTKVGEIHSLGTMNICIIFFVNLPNNSKEISLKNKNCHKIKSQGIIKGCRIYHLGTMNVSIFWCRCISGILLRNKNCSRRWLKEKEKSEDQHTQHDS